MQKYDRDFIGLVVCVDTWFYFRHPSQEE